GRRKFVDAAHNIPFIALGTGLLWFGWYGFNAGSELKVDDITATAFLNTDLAASFAATTWLFVEWWYAKKPHFVGLLTGAGSGVGCSGYAFAFTYVMLKVIDLITPVRVGAVAEEGLDEAMHGESAYAPGI